MRVEKVMTTIDYARHTATSLCDYARQDFGRPMPREAARRIVDRELGGLGLQRFLEARGLNDLKLKESQPAELKEDRESRRPSFAHVR